jgi:hypothetical protein
LRDQIESVESTHDDATFRVDGSLPDNCVNDLSDSVFYNLLRNAVEHNDKAVPEVTISVATTEHTVVVKTVDNGPGIYQDDIFSGARKDSTARGRGWGCIRSTRPSASTTVRCGSRTTLPKVRCSLSSYPKPRFDGVAIPAKR